MTDQKLHTQPAALLKKEALAKYISSQIPDFSVRFKDKDVPWYLKFGWDVSKTFNKRIWTHVTTTVYPNVWFPNVESYEADHIQRFSTLAHEYIHLEDMKDRGVGLFTFLYGFPQILALGALLAPLGFFGFLYAPLFSFFSTLLLLIAVIPFGAPWRSHYEERGYIMSMCCKHWAGRPLDGYPEWLAKTFTNSSYWWMRIDENEALIRFNHLRSEVEKGAFDDEPIYKDVRDIWLS